MRNKKRKLSFWIDSGPNTGMGHISRCRGIVEHFLTSNSWKISMVTDKSVVNVSWMRRLLDEQKLSLCEPSQALFLMADNVVMDTYNGDLLRMSIERTQNRTIRILDQNNESIAQPDSCLDVVLERYSPELRNVALSKSDIVVSKFNSRRIGASIVWNSKLKEVVELRRKKSLLLESNKLVLISFGGSNQVLSELLFYLKALLTTCEMGSIQNIVCFVSEELKDQVINAFQGNRVILVKSFGDEYYSYLAICDVLICSSGTSASEAFHLGIPALIVDIFENASDNWNQLKILFPQARFISRESLRNGKEIWSGLDVLLKDPEPPKPRLSGILGNDEMQMIEDFLLL